MLKQKQARTKYPVTARTKGNFPFKFSTIYTKSLFPEIWLASLYRKPTRLLQTRTSCVSFSKNFNVTSYYAKDTMAV